jgi:hypothetical protein
MPVITIVELQVDSGSNNTNPDHDDVLLYAPLLHSACKSFPTMFSVSWWWWRQVNNIGRTNQQEEIYKAWEMKEEKPLEN